VTTEKPTSSQMTALSTDSRGCQQAHDDVFLCSAKKLAKLEIDRHADPAGLGHITLLGGHEAPALHRGQRGGVEGVTAAALLNLDLPGLPLGSTSTRNSTVPSQPRR
jgi:hypothetical protein